ncbi:MAG: DUF368 domain-containing protein [Clostridiales bacterium]|nr:DUF368 domain-containing protein [Clostridiales bacterium]
MFTILGGFLMGLANSVPGVSGGTIAFIMGFYEDLLKSLVDLVKGKKAEKIAALKLLAKVIIPCGVGLLLAVEVLVKFFDNHIYAISSLFIGFILGAFPVIIRDEAKCLKGKYYNLIFSVLGAGLVILITVLNSRITPSEGSTFELTPLTGIYLFVCGALSMGGMVLPGMSGSTLMLIFGIYMTVIESVHKFLHLDMSVLPLLIIFGFGVLAGAVGIVGLLKKCLEKFRSQTVYMILGLMAGSIYAIFQGPTTLDKPQPAMTMSTFSWIAFIIGIAVIAGLEVLKFFIDKKKKEKENKA